MSERQTPQVISLGSRQNEESLLGGRAPKANNWRSRFVDSESAKKAYMKFILIRGLGFFVEKKLNEN